MAKTDARTRTLLDPHRMRALRRWLPLLVLAAVAATALALGWHRALSLQGLAQHYDALAAAVRDHMALALLAYAALYVAVTALSLPGGAFLTLAGGLLFGWLVAGLVTVLAATAGATLLFLAARSSLGVTLSRRAGPFLSRLAEGFRRDAWSYMLFLRLAPVFPFWLVNLAPALLGVPLRVFAPATLIGIVPGTFAFAFIGAGLDSVLATASRACRAEGCPDLSLRDVVTPELTLALVGLSVLALVPALARRLKSPARSRGHG